MAKANKVKVRILADTDVDGKKYKPGQAVAFDADRAKSLEKAGNVDSTPAAVEYVLSTGTKLIVHEDSEAAEEDPANPNPPAGGSTGDGSNPQQ